MFKYHRLLLDAAAAPATGGDNPTAPAAPAAPATPPPSAVTVLNGEKTERELQLEADLEIAKAEKAKLEGRAKKLETDVSHLQNKLAPPPVPAPGTAPVKSERTPHWLETFGIGGDETAED